jgi:hypothetical protein
MEKFQTIGGNFSLDRTGLFSSSERYVFSITPGPPDFSAVETFAKNYEDSSFSVDESGAFIVGDFRSTDAHGMIQETLDFSMKEEPIQSHPNFGIGQPDSIATIYGYNVTTKEFSINLPDASLLSDIQTAPNQNAAGGDNPMYGVTNYLSLGCIFRKNQTVGDLGEIDGLFDNIGMISELPDGTLIEIPDLPNRNWLKLAPKITSRAGVFEVSEQWQLSGAGGWNSILYKSQK